MIIGLHKMIEKTCLLYKKEKCTLGKEGIGLAWEQKDKGEVIFILDLLHWTGEISWRYKTVLGITITSERWERMALP